MSHTIYIRSRPAAFAVVVKPTVSGLNQLLIESHAAASAYAGALRDRHGWPVVDQSDPAPEVAFRGDAAEGGGR
jgi:hypothetical protein